MRYVEIKYNCSEPNKEMEELIKKLFEKFGYVLVYDFYNEESGTKHLEFDNEG